MLVVDANILIRGVLGQRVLSIFKKHVNRVKFYAPDTAFAEAKRHLPVIISKRGVAPDVTLRALESLALLIETVDSDTYGPFEMVARKRLKGRDEDDWQVLASSIALACPIWTEDADFFGTGAATWTTNRVELFLADLG